MLSAPWQSLIYASIIVGVGGFCGVVYIFRIMHRTRRLTTYTPDLEDWTWYTALPLLGYGAIFAGAIGTFGAPRIALFAIAGGALLLIFIGIRNAWDVVTFLAIGGNDEAQS